LGNCFVLALSFEKHLLLTYSVLTLKRTFLTINAPSGETASWFQNAPSGETASWFQNAPSGETASWFQNAPSGETAHSSCSKTFTDTL
jgi:hypothetical protein